jgi:hypothetical protein
MSGGFRAKPPRFDAILVEDHGHARNLSRALPKIGLIPIWAGPFRFQEEHVGGYLSFTRGHDLRQFAYAGSRARTMGMRQHHERGLAGEVMNRGS